MAGADCAKQVSLTGGEEPHRSAGVFVLLEQLRGHGLAVAILDAREAQHHRTVALERFPEFRFDFRFRVHGRSSYERASIASTGVPGCRRCGNGDIPRFLETGTDPLHWLLS